MERTRKGAVSKPPPKEPMPLRTTHKLLQVLAYMKKISICIRNAMFRLGCSF